MRYPVFVYGTLMRGQRAHAMLQRCEYAADGILPDYAMYDLGRYPGIRPCPGEQVFGELYFADAQALQQMDEYEGNGSLYHRTEVTVCTDAGICPAQVYVYAHSTEGKPLVRDKWNRKQ